MRICAVTSWRKPKSGQKTQEEGVRAGAAMRGQRATRGWQQAGTLKACAACVCVRVRVCVCVRVRDCVRLHLTEDPENQRGSDGRYQVLPPVAVDVGGNRVEGLVKVEPNCDIEHDQEKNTNREDDGVEERGERLAPAPRRHCRRCHTARTNRYTIIHTVTPAPGSHC